MANRFDLRHAAYHTDAEVGRAWRIWMMAVVQWQAEMLVMGALMGVNLHQSIVDELQYQRLRRDRELLGIIVSRNNEE